MILSVIAAISNENERSRVADIYERYGENMYAKAYSILRNDHDAEDAVMCAFERIIIHIDKFMNGDMDSLAGLVMIYTKCAAIDIYRKNKSHAADPLDEVSDMSDDTADVVISNQTAEDIANAMNALTDMQKNALILKYYYGHSSEEIAEIIGSTAEAVRTMLLRARRKLAKILKEKMS